MNVVITFWEPGLAKVIQAGKLVTAFCIHQGSKRVYAYDIPLADRMACLDSWGVAPCVLREMDKEQVAEIHFYNSDEDVTYIATARRVRERGILQNHKRRGVYYYHLPLAEWGKVPGRPCTYPYTREVRSLQWMEEERKPKEPEPLQLGFL